MKLIYVNVYRWFQIHNKNIHKLFKVIICWLSENVCKNFKKKKLGHSPFPIHATEQWLLGSIENAVLSSMTQLTIGLCE